MFALPIVIVPFIVALAVYRLYGVPRLWIAGALRLSRPMTNWLSIVAVLAYATVFGYTLAIIVLAGRAMLHADWTLSTLVDIARFDAPYPIAYVAMEWVFYYAFARPHPQGPGRRA